MGPAWGPPGSCWTQMGPMLAPWTLLSGYACYKRLRRVCIWVRSTCTKPQQSATRRDLVCVYFVDQMLYDDVIRWKRFPRYWPFVRGIHRSPVSSPHKGKWSRALVFSVSEWGLVFFYARRNGCVNNVEAGDFRRPRTHNDVTVMTNLNVNEISASANSRFSKISIIFFMTLKSQLHLRWTECGTSSPEQCHW